MKIEKYNPSNTKTVIQSFMKATIKLK